MEVDRHADRALYLQLADVLRHDITEARLKPGERLPSEAELIQRHNVSRGTVREAVGVLRNEGIVVVEHGRGAYVRSAEQEPLVQRARCGASHVGVREAFESAARDQGMSPSIRRVGGGKNQPLPTGVEEEYGIATGATCTTLLCFGDGRPLQLTRVWSYRDREGASVGEAHHQVAARMPTREERRLLQLADGAPVMTLHRLVREDGNPTEFSDSVIVADRQILTYEMSRTGG